jgi:Lipocalin-like domain
MRKLLGIGLAACFGAFLPVSASRAPRAADQASIRSQLVGTWELVSTEERLTNGSTHSYPDTGPHGKGFLIYTSDGHMCAQLMNPERPKWKDESRPTDAEKVSAFDGFSSYCGEYEVDENAAVVYHSPKTAWKPGWVGTKQQRPFTLGGDILTFAGKITSEPGVESYVIVWRKLPARDTGQR